MYDMIHTYIRMYHMYVCIRCLFQRLGRVEMVCMYICVYVCMYVSITKLLEHGMHAYMCVYHMYVCMCAVPV
jgi:hypothetical protein